MKKTKITKFSHIMMFLSLLFMIFSACMPIVYAEENTTVNDTITEEETLTNNDEKIEENLQTETNNELDNTILSQDFNVKLQNSSETNEGKAKIGDTFYATLVDAVNAVIDDTPTTIELLEDDLNASGVIIPSGRNITIDFGGHTYNVTGNYAGSSGTKNQSFQLLKNSTIVMRNGTIKNTGGYVIIQNYSNLTLTDMVLDGRENSAVEYALSNNNGQVLVNGSTSMYVTSGNKAFDMCWGGNVGYPNGTQMVIDTTGEISGTIELDVWGTFNDDVKSTLEIRNINHVGSFSIDERLANCLTIKGGSFTTKLDSKYLGNGLAYAGSGTYTVVEGKAKIGDTFYATLSDAINSITDGTQTTVELLADELNASGIIIPEGRNITIDFGGHTYNVTGNYAGSTGTKNQSFQLLKNSTIVMRNGTIKNTGGYVIIQNYSNLTLTDMVLDGRENSAVEYALSNNNGQVLVNGSTSMYVTSGNKAFDMCWGGNVGYPNGTQMVIDTTGVIFGAIELDVWGTFKDGVKSTLEIRNIRHIGDFSIDERLANSLTIKGGLFNSSIDAKYLGNGYVAVAVNNVFEVRKLQTSKLSVVEEGGEIYLYENGVAVNCTGAIYIPSTGKTYMFVNGKADNTYTSVVQVGNKYVYLVNGETDTNINGLIEYNNEKYLFKNGVASYNGSKYVSGKRYMFVNGKVDKTYTGIVDAGDKFVYLKNGETATDINGLIIDNDETYLFKNGVANFNGSKYISGRRYMFVNGKVDKTYTGIVDAGDKFVYLKNGETATDINGLIIDNDEIYLFNNGVAKYNGSKYVSGKRYMFVNGKINKTYTGVVAAEDKYIYLVNGETATNFDGLIVENGETYLFKGGIAKHTGSKYLLSTQKRYMLVNGKVNKDYNDIYETPTALIKFLNGVTDISFNGPYLYNYNYYIFNSGVCKL